MSQETSRNHSFPIHSSLQHQKRIRTWRPLTRTSPVTRPRAWPPRQTAFGQAFGVGAEEGGGWDPHGSPNWTEVLTKTELSTYSCFVIK